MYLIWYGLVRAYTLFGLFWYVHVPRRVHVPVKVMVMGNGMEAPVPSPVQSNFLARHPRYPTKYIGGTRWGQGDLKGM